MNDSIVKFVDEPALLALSERIVSLLPQMLPNAAALNELEAMALAQVALMHNLSPFNGELWYLKGSNGRTLGVMPGIKGYRKHAHRQVARISPGNGYNIEYFAASPDEALAPEGSIVVKGILRVASDTENYLRQMQMAYKAFPPTKTLSELDEKIIGLIGHPPIWEAFGVIRPDEFKRFDESRMNKLAQVKVRAERALLRLRFDLDMGFAAYDQPEAIGEADWLDSQLIHSDEEAEVPAPQPEKTPAERKAKREQTIKELGF